MGLFDFDNANAEEWAGLFASMPTLSGKRNPMAGQSQQWSQANQRKKQEEERLRQVGRQKQQDERNQIMFGNQQFDFNQGINDRAIGQQAAQKKQQDMEAYISSLPIEQQAAARIGQFPKAQKPTSMMQNVQGATGAVPGSPQHQAAMAKQLAKKGATTNINMGQNKPLSLADLAKIQLPNGNPVPFGTTMAQAGQMGATLKKKPVAVGDAGKKAMIDTATAQTPIVEGLIFPKGMNGDINQDVIQGMAIKTMTPDWAQMLTSGVSTEGQQAAAAMETGMQAITRLETGAAMQKTEINNTRKRFQPMPWDAKPVQRQKFLAYKLFMQNSKKYFDPNILLKSGQMAAVRAAQDKALAEAAKILKQSKRPPLSSFER